MIDFGHFSLIAAWILSVYVMVAGVIGARRGNQPLCRSARNGLHLVTFFSLTSLVYLAIAFVNHAYRYTYVWQHSNNEMPAPYLVSAVWGGMDGSMLLWAVIMCIFATLVVWRKPDVSRELMNWVVPVLAGGICFFLSVVTFLTNPFRLVPIDVLPTDGNGLNPLLQNPSMMIHPPCLYTGFTGFVVPAAFCLAALLSGKLGDGWIVATRRWTLVAWGFLTAGIILGGNWAYIELGWGGFWAWDPVENASFLPWLSGTAFLHSVMVQERRGMLKVWNVSLAIITYLLTVFGTFLTRSGIVQSVHAFAATDVGWVFLAYIGTVTLISIVLIGYRYQELRPENSIESYFSREAVFLFNNLLLLSICFAVFWGVMFPVISEALSDEKSVVGPPYFNTVTVPLFLALLFFMGVGPLMAWRRMSMKGLLKLALKPFLAGSLLTILLLIFDPSRPLAAMAFGLSFFVAGGILGEFHRGMQARRELVRSSHGAAILGMIRQKPRRYGGQLVHLGVVVMAVSMTAAFVYKTERDLELRVGDSVAIGRYQLELVSLDENRLANYSALIAQVRVWDSNRAQLITTLTPERRFYYRNDEVTTEVDMRMTPREDLYLALAGLSGINGGADDKVDLAQASAVMKVFINPLQLWVWVGGLMMLSGTVIVLIPRAVESHATALEQATVRGAPLRG